MSHKDDLLRAAEICGAVNGCDARYLHKTLLSAAAELERKP